VDLYMVLILQIPSISSRIWNADDAHPTIVGAGCLLTVFTCYFLRYAYWWEIALVGMLGGHLFLHS